MIHTLTIIRFLFPFLLLLAFFAYIKNRTAACKASCGGW